MAEHLTICAEDQYDVTWVRTAERHILDGITASRVAELHSGDLCLVLT